MSTTSSAVSSALDKYSITNSSSTAGSKSSSTSSSSSSSSTSSMGKDQFLQLLVAQLNNQDPLNPQDNTAFVAQLAQFSMVEGLDNLNTSVDSILSDYQSSQALQGASLIGHSVMVESSATSVDTSTPMNGSVVLPSSSSSVYVNIYDSSGSLVRQLDLGTQSAGTVNFSWDGKDSTGNTLSSGAYTFKAEASYNGTTNSVSTILPAKVTSVTLGQNGSAMTLNLSGIGSVALSDVKSISQ